MEGEKAGIIFESPMPKPCVTWNPMESKGLKEFIKMAEQTPPTRGGTIFTSDVRKECTPWDGSYEPARTCGLQSIHFVGSKSIPHSSWVGRIQKFPLKNRLGVPEWLLHLSLRLSILGQVMISWLGGSRSYTAPRMSDRFPRSW